MVMINELRIRVPYADTDQMGMVYYANYLVYFERGRTELLRSCGMTYSQMEQDGFYMPVVECRCNYRSPARYDSLITVKTSVSEIRAASITFDYRIEEDGRLIATGMTKHPMVNRDLRPMRIPESLKKLLSF